MKPIHHSELLHESEHTPATSSLLAALRHTGTLVREEIPIPNRSDVVSVIRPSDIETLLDQSAADPEQNLPYWAEIWPSGIALAAAIAHSPDTIANRPVIELGSGVGITAAMAMKFGAVLTAIDYAPESLIMTRLTARLFTGTEPETRRINWRTPDADLLQRDGNLWPVVLAADVLYEERDIDPVLDVFERILTPGGLVWLAEPGRRPSTLALARASERGWSVNTTEYDGPWPDPNDAGVTVRVHAMTR